ncbi:MAG: hypothetical protein Kow00123_13130 [Anaerolineales bacterium]
MTPSPAKRGIGDLLAPLLFAAIALGIGWALRGMALDDPFITYRYAENLAAGRGFVYNEGERVLSTTTPLYALLLAVGRLLTPDLPALSNGIGVLSIWAGAWLLYRMARQFGRPAAGLVAGALYAAFPLLWLSLGFEVPLYLFLALLGFHLHFRGRTTLAAIPLGLATLTRFDGAIPAGVVFLLAGVQALRGGQGSAARRLWSGLGRPVLVYLAVMAPVLLWLTWYFGSPVPVTLGAKSAQTALGVTGFYAGTTFVQGALILAKAWFSQTPLYALLAVAALAGLAVALWRDRWALALVLWAALYGVGYHVLRVAPYHWYYAPFVPAGVLLAGLGVAWVGGTRGRGAAVRWGAGAILAAATLLALGISDSRIAEALRSDAPISPDRPDYKALPEAKTAVYRQVGEWLAANTPADADVGVTEVGVMGYYAKRRMLDFLGLLRPPVAQALARGDVAWALFHYQPDYLALTEVNPLYSYDIRRDEWFRAAYAPVQQFPDARFWGGPVTVYRRVVPRSAAQTVGALPASATPLHVRFGTAIQLLGYETAAEEVRPGHPLTITLYWQASAPVGDDVYAFVHLLGEHDIVIAQRDGVPCMGGCPTRGWQAGQIYADRVLLALPQTAYAPDRAVWEVGFFSPADGHRLPAYAESGAALGDHIRFGSVSVLPNAGNVPNPQDIRFEGKIALVGYDIDRRAAAPGETLRITLYWKALASVDKDYTVFVHLLGEGADIWGQRDSMPQGGLAPTSAWQVGQIIRDEYEVRVKDEAPPLVCTLEVGLYDAATGTRLNVVDADGHVRDNRALLAKVRIVR